MTPPRKEIAVTIVEAVATATETPIEDLPPLPDAIDPDALDAIVTDDRSADISVSFTYAGLDLFVRSGDPATVHVNHG